MAFDSLDIVRGAVSKKDLIPVLMHIAFTEGHVHGANGILHICAPAPEFSRLPSFTVDAQRFLPVLDAFIDGVPKLVVKDGILRVHGGLFRASIPTGKIEEFPMSAPPAKGKVLKAPLLPILRAVRPFISEDASRPWSQTVKFDTGYAYATNNVAIIAQPVTPITLSAALKGAVLPVFVIDELLRIGIEPVAFVHEGTTVAFTYPSKAWVRCALSAYEWPDAAALIESVHGQRRKLPAIPAALRVAVERLRPLCPDITMPVISFNDSLVLTGAGVLTGDLGGQVEIKGAKLGQGSFHADQLLLMLSHATHADFAAAPRVPWSGDDGALGVLIGVKR